MKDDYYFLEYLNGYPAMKARYIKLKEEGVIKCEEGVGVLEAEHCVEKGAEKGCGDTMPAAAALGCSAVRKACIPSRFESAVRKVHGLPYSKN